MSAIAPVHMQAKKPAVPGLEHAGQLPLGVPAYQAERSDLSAQLEKATRLGHSLEAISVDGSAPPIVQRQGDPERKKGEGEAIQMQWKPAAGQRQVPSKETEDDQTQMQQDFPRVGLEGGLVAPGLVAAIQHARGGGQPLDNSSQAQMSETLGHDFSAVRVHTGAEADVLNRQLSARAFTTGPDIFFRMGTYNPGSGSGQELLAHELSHVVQQSTGRVRGMGSGITVRPAGDQFEQEAEATAQATKAQPQLKSTSKRPVNIGMSSRQAVQRDCWTMSVQQRASFENSVFKHYGGGSHFWRLQPNFGFYHGSFFSPVVDDKPEEILKDGKVDPEERRQLAVKHEWVPEWKYLVLYDVKPKNNKVPYYGKTGAQTEKGPGGELLPGGAEQVVFPPGKEDKTVSILKWGYVVEEDPKKKVKRIGAPGPLKPE